MLSWGSWEGQGWGRAERRWAEDSLLRCHEGTECRALCWLIPASLCLVLTAVLQGRGLDKGTFSFLMSCRSQSL